MVSALAYLALSHAALLPSTAPKLVVLISIDQGRADYIDRFTEIYLPPKQGKTIGGLRWLSETGVRYTDAHHHHVPTFTAVGHAVLMTGSVPAINGVIANEWWDRVNGKAHYSTEDDAYKTIGGESTAQSARPLKVTTVGDELKMATNGRSKVVGISFKDRASILMAGHAADEVVWFDYKAGNFVTSTYFSDKLPNWADEYNKSRAMDAYLGTEWKPSLPESAFVNSRNAPHEKGSKMFAHKFATEKSSSYYSSVVASSKGQDVIFDLAEKAIIMDKLGTHETPDVLVLNLASNDYVGHGWGPNSPEVLDVWGVTDKRLSRMFNLLDTKVPGGINNVAIVVSADHGVSAIPSEMANVYKIGAARVSGSEILKAVDAALVAKYGGSKWTLDYDGFNITLDRAAMDAKNLDHSEVERVAAAAAMTVPGVYQAFTRTAMLNGNLPHVAYRDFISNGYHPTLGGDIVIVDGPNQIETGATGTTHGSTWAYDTHVPILTRWGGQTPRKVARRVYTYDIASTLSTLLGIEYPSGNVGKPLWESLPDGFQK
ncbi:MAG: alkaline phosphatase family protein [Armatimonadetes bacterium]|nr:alkaline phosphatase family protein [Armatimonadota bacterium]